MLEQQRHHWQPVGRHHPLLLGLAEQQQELR